MIIKIFYWVILATLILIGMIFFAFLWFFLFDYLYYITSKFIKKWK
jgi:hypothetical protein